MDLEQLARNLNSTEKYLLYYMVKEQQETNRLLAQLIENKPTVKETDEISALKRPQLMKMMKDKNAPKGWVGWGNDKMIEFLKGVS